MDPSALAVLKVVLAVFLMLLIARLVFIGMPGSERHSRVRPRTIRVVGVGGGGSNAVNAMVRSKTGGVDFIACNTDAQALAESAAHDKLQIGAALTEGLGAGGDPAIGQLAAQEDAERIGRAVEGYDIVFVTAGLGGGTGSGAAAVVARVAREHGALTIGVVTKPFEFEGPRRRAIADEAADALRANVDALITVPNDRVRGMVADAATIPEALGVVDEVLRQAVQGIIDVIAVSGLVNLDFADVRSLLKDAGPTVMGIGRAAGENRVVEATRKAIASGLLEDTIDGATRILLNVSGSSGLTLRDVTTSADAVRAVADREANITFGTSFDPRLGDEVVVTVIATGLRRRAPARQPAATRLRPVARRGARMRRAVPAPRPARAPAAAVGAARVARTASPARPLRIKQGTPPARPAAKPSVIAPAKPAARRKAAMTARVSPAPAAPRPSARSLPRGDSPAASKGATAARPSGKRGVRRPTASGMQAMPAPSQTPSPAVVEPQAATSAHRPRKSRPRAAVRSTVPAADVPAVAAGVSGGEDLDLPAFLRNRLTSTTPEGPLPGSTR